MQQYLRLLAEQIVPHLQQRQLLQSLVGQGGGGRAQVQARPPHAGAVTQRAQPAGGIWGEGKTNSVKKYLDERKY